MIAVGVAILGVLVFMPRTLGFVSSVALAPIVQVQTWIAHSSAALPTYLRDRGELRAEKQDLRMQLAEHAGAALSARRLAEENERLRGLLGATSTDRIAAAVVGRPPALPYDVFLIDKGTRDGITENAPVYIGTDQVIGFVGAVYRDRSVVTLATTPDFTATAYIYGPDIYTTATGRGSGSLRVSVPQGITLSEGDLVVLPALHAGIYGSISVVDSEPSRPEQYGYVSIEEPLASLQYVSVGSEPLADMSYAEAEEVVTSVRADLLEVPVPQKELIDMETATGTATSSATSTAL